MTAMAARDRLVPALAMHAVLARFGGLVPSSGEVAEAGAAAVVYAEIIGRFVERMAPAAEAAAPPPELATSDPLTTDLAGLFLTMTRNQNLLIEAVRTLAIQVEAQSGLVVAELMAIRAALASRGAVDVWPGGLPPVGDGGRGGAGGERTGGAS